MSASDRPAAMPCITAALPPWRWPALYALMELTRYSVCWPASLGYIGAVVLQPFWPWQAAHWAGSAAMAEPDIRTAAATPPARISFFIPFSLSHSRLEKPPLAGRCRKAIALYLNAA